MDLEYAGYVIVAFLLFWLAFMLLVLLILIGILIRSTPLRFVWDWMFCQNARRPDAPDE